jgi:Flp pilus assembly protein TadD
VSSQVFWGSARGRAYARTGRVEEGEVLARQAVDLARGTVDICLLGGALLDLADVLGQMGRRDEAEPPLREALQLFEQKEDRTSVLRVRGLLGEPAAA